MTELTTDSKININLVREAIEAVSTYGQVIQDLTFAQAILEGGLLNSPPSQLALKYNNLFGIKGRGTGKLIDGQLVTTVSLPTNEFINGKWERPLQNFAVNASVEDSVAEHLSLFLRLSCYKNLFNAKTLEEAAGLVRKDGYATDPKYTKELIDIYNSHIRGINHD